MPIALAISALAAPASATAVKPRSGVTPPLSHEGRWVTDARDRVAIFHGLNMVYKVPPYEPKATGFGKDDAKFLRRQGFNAVRLGIIYKGLEPDPPAGGAPGYRDDYLDSIARTRRTLARSGVHTLLDFHQDMYNERFQGEGWPDWAVDDDGLPAEPKNGFPLNYIGMPALNRAFDHFWGNDQAAGRGLQDAYAEAWRHVAERFAGKSFLLGYDLLNEPWPGSTFPSCFSPEGCPAFDSTSLTEFSKRTIAAIRHADPSTLAFYEPLSIFNFGAATSHGDTGDPNAGMSFHVYCLTGVIGVSGDCDALDDLVFQNAEAQSKRTGDALLMTEFGATDDLAALNRDVMLSDEHMMSWFEWHYCACQDPTTTGPGNQQALVIDPAKPPTGENVKLDKLKVLERSYPQAVAGTPKSWSFDPETHAFHLAYSTTAPHGDRLPRRTKTVVSTPRIQYPDGYKIEVDGAKRVSRRSSRLLRLKRNRGAGEVELAVRPR
jgi:endoglycosylceramidase